MQVVLLDDGTTLVSRLILDVMGNSSPIVHQIHWGQRPDGVCLVVGTCARGFENNITSDLIYTRTLVTQVGSNKTQYFWERAMSMRLDIDPSPDFINNLLSINFQCMESWQLVTTICDEGDGLTLCKAMGGWAICARMDDGTRPWLVCLMLSSRNVVWSIVDHGNNGAGQGAFRGSKRTHEGVDVVVAECSSLGTTRF
ncbi:unnamed protein product [Sphagnum jensenii]